MKHLLTSLLLGVTLFLFNGCGEEKPSQTPTMKCEPGKCGEGKCGDK